MEAFLISILIKIDNIKGGELLVHQEEGKLKRNLGLREGIAYVIGFVIGTGIFLKPAVVLVNMGSSASALIIWIVGGLISMCSALTISEIAAYIPKVGGLYTYLVELYNDVVGFLYGWIEVIISSPGGSAALAIACATFATYFIPMGKWELKFFAIFITLLIVILQIISTKLSLQMQGIATIGKLVPMAAIIIFGLINGTAHDISFATSGIIKGAGTGVALLGVLWSYDGWMNTCTLGDEMIHPEKNLPKAIIIGLAFVIIVYALFNTAIFNVMSAPQVAASESIGVDVSKKLFGRGGTTLITIGMLLSSFAALNAQLASGIRVAFAMGQKKQLPKYKILNRVNPKLGTPVNSIIFQTVISIIFILLGNFNTITDLCIFVIWIFFTLGVFSIFILRKKYPRDEKLYKVPLYPIIPIIGGIGGLYLIFVTIRDSFKGSMLGLALTLIGLPVYYYCKKKYSDKDDAVKE